VHFLQSVANALASAVERSRAAARLILVREAERRRLARDLHDGALQELGWVRSALLRGATAGELLPAVDRAMAGLHDAIAAKTSAPDEPLALALTRAVHGVGDRLGVPITLTLDEAVVVAPAVRDELMGVAREAVTNAARHSGSPTVQVTLSDGRLTVGDDGHGFDPTYGRPGGFGLTSMRERADAIGAALTITSAPGHGTCVEVTW
jgi:signal transduction histidine kinase